MQAALGFIFALYTFNCSVWPVLSGFRHFLVMLNDLSNVTNDTIVNVTFGNHRAIMTMIDDKVQQQLVQLWFVSSIQSQYFLVLLVVETLNFH